MASADGRSRSSKARHASMRRATNAGHSSGTCARGIAADTMPRVCLAHSRWRDGHTPGCGIRRGATWRLSGLTGRFENLQRHCLPCVAH